MNLLYTATAYPPSVGGAQFHMHALARALAPRHRVQVVSQWDRHRTDWLLGTTVFAPRARDYLQDGIPVHRLGFSIAERTGMAAWVGAYYPAMAFAVPRLARTLERHLRPFADAADLVHNVRIGREVLTQASLSAARARSIPFVLTPVHHPRWTGWRYREYERLYREADLVLALTTAEAQTLAALGVREERIRVIGHGPILEPQQDGPSFIRRHDIRGPIVLFVGQHFSYKGYRELLKAAPLVWRRAPDTHFVFVGPPVGQSERHFAAGGDRRVIRLGAVNAQEKSDAMAAATVLCVPSMQESFGGVYVEAWSLGKPVIGCPIPAVAEVVSDGIDGFLLPQDPALLADRLTWLLENPAKAAEMGRAGQRKVEARYSWKRIGELTEAAYRAVMSASMPAVAPASMEPPHADRMVR